MPSEFDTKERRIAWLKMTAAKHYNAYMRLTKDYDCGKHMAEYLVPEAALHRDQFNAAMNKLFELDPDNCPVYHL